MKWAFLEFRSQAWEADQAIELLRPDGLPELRLADEDLVGAAHAYGDLYLRDKKRLPNECSGCRQLKRMKGGAW